MDDFVKSLLAQPTLDAAAERSLARKAREGDRAAREELITAGMRAVALRAMLHGFKGDELRDAVQSGAVGLIRAVDRFDPDREARLATYAWHWIGSAMRPGTAPDAAIDNTRGGDGDSYEGADDLLDGMPDELAEIVRLRYGLGRPDASPMTLREVAEHSGLTVAQVRRREAKAMRHLRLRLAKVVHRAPHRGDDPL